MAQKKYIETIKDEDGNLHYIKDAETAGRVDVLEDQISDGLPGVGTSDVATSVINANGGNSAIRIWVGTRTEYNSIDVFEPDVVYLIGTATEGYTPDTPSETKHVVTLELTGCSSPYGSNAQFQVIDGNPLSIQLSKPTGYSITYCSVLMDIDGTNDDITDDAWDSTNETINIDSVTGNVYIHATAIIKLESITVRNITTSLMTNNYQFVAEFTPDTTEQRRVDWSIDNTTDFELEVTGEASATVRAKESASNALVTVTCTSGNNPEISDTETLSGVTYVSFEPGTGDGTTTHQGTDAISFADPLVKSILCSTYANGIGDDNIITYDEAAAAEGSAPGLPGSNITSFDEWQYFVKANFSVKNCSSLASVVLPKITGLDYFDSRFGIEGTALTSIAIPEGYLYYGKNFGEASLSGNPLSGSSIASISFPSTLIGIKLPLLGLPALTSVDLSGTVLSSIECADAFYNLSNLETVKFPDTLTVITKIRTFRNCSKLSLIEFGTGFTGSSGKHLFGDSNAIVNNFTIVFHGTTPPDDFVISGSRKEKLTAIYVPYGCKTAYTSKTYFEEFASLIEELPEE